MPLLPSFVESANATSPFPLNNLPFGVRRVDEGDGHVVVAIGDLVLDLALLASLAPDEFAGPLLTGASAAHVFASGSLNTFLELGTAVWSEVRAALQDILSASPTRTRLRDDASLRASVLLPASSVDLLLPVRVGDYTDFYSSRAHATNVGSMFRDPSNALLPNWSHLPVAYHGRASSVVVSGTPIRRPRGQLKPTDDPPVHAASRLLDFELEMAAVIGGPENPLGDPVSVADAADRVFGYALLNDWSARDVQKWEYVPLGPFGESTPRAIHFPRGSARRNPNADYWLLQARRTSARRWARGSSRPPRWNRLRRTRATRRRRSFPTSRTRPAGGRTGRRTT